MIVPEVPGVVTTADLERTAEEHGFALGEILPVAGCDPGTFRAFSRLAEGEQARSLVGKTGTLTHTDNGVTVLAGRLHAEAGATRFCVAIPDASGRVPGGQRLGSTSTLACSLVPLARSTSASSRPSRTPATPSARYTRSPAPPRR